MYAQLIERYISVEVHGHTHLGTAAVVPDYMQINKFLIYMAYGYFLGMLG